MNIIEMILKLLGGSDFTNKIAGLLGIGQDQANKAVTAAVPSLVAAFAGAASKPGGPEKLADAVSLQDTGLLDNIGRLFSGGGAASSQGSNVLSNLIGNTGMSQFNGVLSRFTGVSEGGTNKLLRLLTPLVLGAIGKAGKGLGPSGLANMLMGQKDNIASALPSGLGNLLGSAIPGVNNLLGSAANQATDAMDSVGRQVAPTTRSAARWLVPVALIALALFFVPKLFRKTADTTESMGRPGTEAVTAVTGGGSQFITDATSVIRDTTASIASIKDEPSATAALPKLRELSGRIEGLNDTLAKMPASTQATARDSLRPLIGTLRQTIQSATALPLVGDKLQPVTEEILAQLNKLVPPA